MGRLVAAGLTMADHTAASFDLASAFSSASFLFSRLVAPNTANLGITAVPLKASTLYKNRGVYLGALISWVSLGQPSPVPPGGIVVSDYCWELLAF